MQGGFESFSFFPGNTRQGNKEVQYYIYALIFVIFAIEAAFLFPWAVAYNQLQFYMVLEGVFFILILGGGLLYAWRKGALEWL